MNMEAGKEKICRIKEEEEQAIREALGLAPKLVTRPQGTWLNKHEFLELVKRGPWSWFLKIAQTLGRAKFTICFSIQSNS